MSFSLLYAFREALALVAEEGLEQCWSRHRACMEQFHSGIQQLGLTMLVKDPEIRLPILTAIEIPSDLADDWLSILRFAMEKYKVEIGSGLGSGAGKLLRIAFMGHNAQPETVQLLLKVLGEALQHARLNKTHPAQL